ncbi:flavin reductase family protein [Phocaeicola coprocola]|uniref:flavin reductase family protein n=1 Tax=Phocaeicola coprocola TaxID=310298 RepID=UPI001956F871|nr:flavin reductase family protein [Phocaeicola coprocola]MBM6903052.1 flavin reductase family protein [Phocaeicola coprocola]
MKEINVSELKDNMFDAISKEWMLVTAGTQEKFNMMTASWGGTGVLWAKPVAFIFIRPERYTYQFIEEGETLTLSFLGEEHKDIHKICGSKSGRDIDKVAATGLKPFATPEGNIAYEQARMVLECRKLYADMIKPEQFIDASLVSCWYGEGHGGFHKMYVVEIEHVWVKE